MTDISFENSKTKSARSSIELKGNAKSDKFFLVLSYIYWACREESAYIPTKAFALHSNGKPYAGISRVDEQVATLDILSLWRYVGWKTVIVMF